MPLVPEVRDFPVYDQGLYKCQLESVTIGERQPFGSQDQSEKEACLNFIFRAVTGPEEGFDGVYKPLLIDDKPVKFFIKTGCAYGGARASLTRITNQMVGRALDLETEAPRFDYEKLIDQCFNLMVTKEPTNSGGERNTVAGIEPAQPIDVASCLIAAPTKK
jgi:hypothetical protein